jgi:4-hydroxyphenylpyruvate dioxygenase
VLTSALNPAPTELLGGDIGAHLTKHGDGVKDIAFSVSDARAVFAYAVERGAKVVSAPAELSDAEGAALVATVQTYGDTTHTFVQRGGYGGAFLPGFRSVAVEDPLERVTPPVGLDFIDHIVGNVPDGDMEPTVQWYERMLSFHRFWSVDDSQMHTEFSALRSIVVADHGEVVKMPINEPAAGKRKSQIQEYCDYYAGAGVQHIAISTRDIITAISHLRARGVNFLRVPDTYYDALEARLAKAPFAVKEDLATLRRLNILLDMDDKGYLLQLFTQCIQDRPTVFLEIIQREGCSGFGAGNFKSLFEAIESACAPFDPLRPLPPSPTPSHGAPSPSHIAPRKPLFFSLVRPFPIPYRRASRARQSDVKKKVCTNFTCFLSILSLSFSLSPGLHPAPPRCPHRAPFAPDPAEMQLEQSQFAWPPHPPP